MWSVVICDSLAAKIFFKALTSQSEYSFCAVLVFFNVFYKNSQWPLLTSKQAPCFLPWFEELNNSPKEMTQYYTYMYLMPGKLLVVGQQEQEGDSDSSNMWGVHAIWGIQAWKAWDAASQPPPSHCSTHQAVRGCPQVWSERQHGGKHILGCQGTWWLPSPSSPCTEPPNFLAQAAKIFQDGRVEDLCSQTSVFL